jgi:predicted metal-dependent peptidase
LEIDFVLLHEVLHCALHHVTRRGDRDPYRWNVAADIVVNGLLFEVPTVQAPAGIVTSEILRPESSAFPPTRHAHRMHARTRPDVSGASAEEVYAVLSPLLRPIDGSWTGDLEPQPSSDDSELLDEHWRLAFERAAIQHRLSAGSRTRSGRQTPALDRLIARRAESQIDWRSALWQYLSRHPSDYSGIDRRFVADEIYLDALGGEALHVQVAVDTSGSVDSRLLGAFIEEVESILSVHQHVAAELYWADHEIHAPHPVRRGGELPAPRGWRGTDFRPFFEHLDGLRPVHGTGVAVYLTDGYGAYPQSSNWDTIWLLPEHGAPDTVVPFGRVLRIPEA